MSIVVSIGRKESNAFAVVREKETGYGREIDEEKSNCSRQAFSQNIQDEISRLFQGQNDESGRQSRVPVGQTQSHGLFGQE